MLGKWGSPEAILDAEHALMWSQHGGSGYNYTRADFLDMTWVEIEDRIDRADRARRDMSAAMKRSHDQAVRDAKAKGR